MSKEAPVRVGGGGGRAGKRVIKKIKLRNTDLK